MTEHVEIYGQTITPDVEERLTQRRTQAEAQAEARALQAEALSMPLLAAQDRAKSRIQNAKAWCEARGLTPLSVEDRAAWVAWLPTAYATTENEVDHRWGFWLGEERVQDLREYRYHEGVPAHVRQLMEQVKGIFSRLEIRTPEKQPILVLDPVLFGHIEHPDGRSEIYTLARWGESDVNLISLEEIKQIISLRQSKPLSFFDSFFLSILIGFMCAIVTILGVVCAVELGFMENRLYESLFLPAMYLPAMILSCVPLSLWLYTKLTFASKLQQLRQTAPHLVAAV